MKKHLFLFAVGAGITVLAQSNYEHSLQEKEAFQQLNQVEGITLEADYVPEYYRLEFNSNPNVNSFSGKTTMHFTTTTETNEIKLNARSYLDITSVSYHSTPITNFTKSGGVLTITLPEMLEANHLDSISVSFSGSAVNSSGYNIGQQNGSGSPVASTISEPWHASSWWVCKDDLIDKVNKLDVLITHPTEMKAASNGNLLSVTDLGNGSSITHWQHNYAIPAYLVAISVTDYEEYTTYVEVNGTNLPIVNYLYPGTLQGNQYNIDLTGSYISSINAKYGEYPYLLEKYGHAEWERGGGMEHSTMSFMGSWSQGLIKHELAHQWFGNKVTCGTWSDIWINEGFAEYTDGWLEEEFNGENAFTQWKEDYVWYITDSPDGSVWNPFPENENRIFNYRLTYAKASMMVHLIRYILNDDDLFYQALRDFLDHPEYTYGFATTPDLKSSLESSTGMNWDEYFNDWIYGEGHPIFNIHVNNHAENSNLTVRINQTQSHGSVDFFETPFEIEFRGGGGQETTRKFYLTENGQEFLVTDIPFEVTSYTFNPKFDLVCRVNSQTMDNFEVELTSTKAVIYPNPVEHYFFVEYHNLLDEIKIFDVNGKVVYTQNNINQNKIQIDTKYWPSGTYMVQIKSGSRTQLMKVLVK